TSAPSGERTRKFAAAPMMASPTTPSAIFWGLGALTIGSKIGGSGISALEAAGDLEGHQAGRLAEVTPGNHDIDVLELSRAPKILHEVRHRRRRERGPAHLQPEILTRLEPGDPQVLRDHVGEDVHQGDRPRLALHQLLEDRQPSPKILGLGPHLVDLADRHLELRELRLAGGDLGGELRPLGGEHHPVAGDADDREDVDDAEERAQVEAREREREAGEADPPSPLRLGREVDPDHLPLSPTRLSPSPTAPASAGPAVLTSSPLSGSVADRADERAG